MAPKFNPELSDISEEGLKIRKAYVGQMRMQKHNPTYGNYLMARYDGGTDDDGREYSTNVWDKLVAVFEVNELDTYEYVEFAFSQQAINTPYDLKKESLIQRYRKLMYSDTKPNMFKVETQILETNLVIRRSQYDLEKALNYALNDNALGVSPLVRYSYACKHNVPFLVVDSIKDAAYKQYMNRRFFYNHFFKDDIPEEFTNERSKN